VAICHDDAIGPPLAESEWTACVAGKPGSRNAGRASPADHDVDVFFRVLLLDTASIPFDLQDWQYPRLAFMGAALRRGNFPLWNPYLYGGMPMPADRCFTRYAWQQSG